MRLKSSYILVLIILMGLVGCSASSSPSPTPTPPLVPSATATSAPPSPPTSTPASEETPTSIPVEPTLPPVEPTPTPLPGDPFEYVSQDSLFSFLDDLTTIQAYSGWRNSATEGEVEALDYVAAKLGGFEHLQSLGLELERQSFRVFLATELWETRLHLTVNGQETEVPADGLRGPRDDIAQTIRFDSDGTLNDSNRDPVVVEGAVALVRTADEISLLSWDDVRDKIVFLDYVAIDRALMGRNQVTEIAAELLDKEPAGVVMVTSLLSGPDESHGTFVGDLSAFNGVETSSAPPILYARLEDLGPAGIESWGDLAQVEAARLTWDADVFSPGESGNLVARIPGADSSQAVILGAHIDSPNAPGAMDDGSGSVVLLQVAHALNAARVQPPTDVYLVWFGSEEIGLYGSYHFVSTHQELLDRTLAMLQIDCLARPIDGIDAYLNLVTWSYGRLGDDRLTWPDYLVEVADRQGIWIYPTDYYGIESDNSAFSGFDVPSANLIYMNSPEMASLGGFHHAAHVHSPYDTAELAWEEGDALEQMARVALSAALETGQDDPELRVAPTPDRRVLFVASHTESVHIAPATFTDLGMAFAWEGFDVDMIPYGQTVTDADLVDIDLVVVLPVMDYPGPDRDTGVYDEAWSEDEITALEAYVSGGGLLALTNSAHRLKYCNRVQDLNEDWSDVNALAERFGVSYQDGGLSRATAGSNGGHSLMEGISSLELAGDNGVRFVLSKGQVLAQVGREPIVALIDYGGAGGQVLALADVGILSSDCGEPANLDFWLNLAEYARSR
ncbi:MAG: Zn-dependent exopeptidase M28 [Chloroflexi bacterium]|nr:Zn-dependent exopeptidase M28 [Chloroflexota bacterium]